MSSNQLQCDGNVYKSFVDVIKSLNAGKAAVCVGPSRVAGAQFYSGGSYQSFYRQEFTYCKWEMYMMINYSWLISS